VICRRMETLDRPPSAALSRYGLCARLMLDPATAEALFRRPAWEVHSALQALQAGAEVMKCGRKGRLQARFIRINDEGTGLFWQSRKKSVAESTIYFADVDRVQLGMHTSTFARLGQALQERHAHLALSIVCSGGRTLDLILVDATALDVWHTGLQAFLLHQRSSVEDSDVRVCPLAVVYSSY